MKCVLLLLSSSFYTLFPSFLDLEFIKLSFLFEREGGICSVFRSMQNITLVVAVQEFTALKLLSFSSVGSELIPLSML